MAVVAAVALALTTLNSGQSVTLRLGFLTLRGIPVSAVAFGGFVAGMIVILVAGVFSDLRVRRILQARLVEDTEREREAMVDHRQKELFAPDRDRSGPDR